MNTPESTKPLVDRIFKPIMIVCGIVIVVVGIAIFAMGKINDARAEKQLQEMLTNGTPEQKIQAIMIQMNPIDMTPISIEAGESTTAVVKVMAEDYLDEKELVTSGSLFTIDLMQAILNYRAAENLNIEFYTNFVDPKGNESEGVAVSFYVTKKSIANVNYDNFSAMVRSDYKKMSTVAEVNIHPAILKNLP